jgi:ComF family protein
MDRPLGTLLAEYCVRTGLKPQVIVPVPLHTKRLKMRGFNQSLLLARALRKRLSVDLDYLNLRRVVPTKPQAGLKAVARHENVAGAFHIQDPGAFRGRRVLLVDDVYTTGATVTECSKLLRKADAVVFVLTLARAVKA